MYHFDKPVGYSACVSGPKCLVLGYQWPQWCKPRRRIDYSSFSLCVLQYLDQNEVLHWPPPHPLTHTHKLACRKLCRWFEQVTELAPNTDKFVIPYTRTWFVRPNLHRSPLSPLCNVFSSLMWREFAICSNMGLHFSTEHHNASPDPLLLRKSRWHNSLQPETVRAHRERREGRWMRRGGEGWRGRGARLEYGRPVQLHSLLSAAAASGGIQ